MTGVDLTNCDREPIHIPGAIQPHGALLACRLPDLLIEQASDNLSEMLGVSAGSALGRNAEAFFSRESATALRLVAHSNRPRDEGPLRIVAANGRPFDAVLHRASDEILVIELEPPSGELSFHPRLRRSVARFSRTQRIEELWADAADEVRALTGFDRVMVYRFDAEWNGEVVAESQRGDLESFLGLHYPASDIPAQARRLYTINWLRFIGDVNYEPVALRADRHRPPLDMSFCVLRSVSPIHCEYLRNMGVTASMSISLLRDERLWGLIACHHYSGPKVVPYPVRESSEFLGRALSWHIASRLREETATRGLAVKHVESQLIHAMNAAGDYRDGLATSALLALTNATGAAVLVENELRTIGETPAEQDIRDLARWLCTEQRDELFVTDRLGAQYAQQALERTASGVLAVALSRELGDFVIWFRPSAERVVSWGGEPSKQVVDAGGIPRLSPRGSFALWKETVRGRSEPWQDWEQAAASDLRLALLASVRRRAADLRELNDKLIAADRSKDMFLAAVSHELRTPLHAILGWVQRIQGGTLDPQKMHKALEIIERNARIQSQLVDDLLDVARMVEGKLSIDPSPVDLASVVENAIDSVSLSIESAGIELAVTDLAPCRVIGDPARLQQVTWNLLTNAFKFTPVRGRIQVALHRNDGMVELTVTDSGQGLTPESIDKLFEPFWQVGQGSAQARKGLGLGLAISRHIVELHGGTIAAESRGLGHGATFRVSLPLASS